MTKAVSPCYISFPSYSYSVVGNYFLSLLVKRVTSWVWYEIKEIPELPSLGKRNKWNIIKHIPVDWNSSRGLWYLAAGAIFPFWSTDTVDGGGTFLISGSQMSPVTALLSFLPVFPSLPPSSSHSFLPSSSLLPSTRFLLSVSGAILTETLMCNSSQLFWGGQRHISFIPVLWASGYTCALES